MSDLEICRWDGLAGHDRGRLEADLDHVFFSSSTRQSFASGEEKAAFRDRWLGRYLEHFPHLALVAVAHGSAVGYVVGALADPARDPLFADLGFLADFAALTARYPAHLHVNVDVDWRGHGVGARLVAAFAARAREAGAPGVHVVTARGMRNVGFYLANRFEERGALETDGRALLFLGRDL